MNDSCVFCAADVSAAGELVHDFGDFRLLLHPDSAVRGHAMLVARRHVENIAGLTDDETRAFAIAQRISERALLDATGTDRAILLKLGIQVPHLHVHIYPVRETMGRAAVMDVIDAKVREEREPGFSKALSERVRALTPPFA